MSNSLLKQKSGLKPDVWLFTSTVVLSRLIKQNTSSFVRDLIFFSHIIYENIALIYL